MGERMTVKATRAAYLTDASYVLRDIENGAETTSAIEEGVRIFSRKGPYWEGDANAETYTVAMTVNDIRTDGDQSYLISFWAHYSATSVGAVELLSIPVKGVGSFVVTLDRSTFDAAWPNENEVYVRVGVSMSGENETRITYGATLTTN